MTEAKRKLSEIDFNSEGAHIALTSKTLNGGPANQRTTLLFKGSEEIEKAEVQLKLDVVDFLSRFFGLWTGEAATIAEIFGVNTNWFDEDFTFEEFNSIGASEVTLLKSAYVAKDTEDDLSNFVEKMSFEDLTTLKSFKDKFNTLYEDHTQMTQSVEKALEEQKAELEKAAEAKLAEVQKAAEDAQAKLAEIQKAEEAKVEAEFISKAEALGGDEDLGKAMAMISKSEAGVLVIEALEKAHKQIDEVVEKEAGFSGDGDEAEKVSGVMKSLQAKFNK